MDLGISGKRAFVGGSSRGIGRAVAEALLREGATVVLSARGDELLGTAADLRELYGDRVLWVRTDLSTREGVSAAISYVNQKLGGVDILVNNIGGPPPGAFPDISELEWRRSFERNFMSFLRLTEGFLPSMVQNGWGRIVNIVSITVREPYENLDLSNTMRSAVVAWAKNLARRYARFGITVNNVAPGYILTKRLRNLLEAEAREKGRPFEEVLEEWRHRVPAGRLGKPEEVGNLVAFLCSERASYINGVTILIDGGLSRCLP